MCKLTTKGKNLPNKKEIEFSHYDFLSSNRDFLLNDSSHFIPFDDEQDSCDTFMGKLAGIEIIFKEKFLDLEKIAKAYIFAYEAHGTQRRKSGEPYIMHPVSVAIILAKLKQDTSTVIAALLHDVIEDTLYEYDNISEIFGEDVASIVDGVTKVSGAEKEALKEQYAADTYRKMILATSKNPRTIIVKLADRLHNLSTLDALSSKRQKAIAMETLDVYAPIAAEMGIYALKNNLEDMSMKYAYPEEYEQICHKTDVENEKNTHIIKEFSSKISSILQENHINDFEVFGRVKSIYSIFRKHKDREVPYDEIYDILGCRIICRSELECYKIMGLLHKYWQPIGDKIKDYIALPKDNGYKSLHTTLICDEQHIEIQIRTFLMDMEAEYGFAAHNNYKDGLRKNKFLDEFSSWEKEFTDPAEFLGLLKSGIMGNEITLFLKKGGKIIKIPDGATVLDLAYYISPSVGNKCSGAIIDGKIAPIDRKLFNNETIDLLTSTDAKPSIDWLSIVKTPKAKSAIRKRIRQMESDDKANRAFNLLISAYDYVNEPISFDEYKAEILKYFSLEEEKDLFDRIYSGEITTDDILRFTRDRTSEENLGKFAQWILGKKKQHKLLIDSLKNSNQIRPALCCNPLPGEKIVGFVTSGDRGISIHREICENALIFADDKDKLVRCEWSPKGDFGIFYEEISILGDDKDSFFPDVIGAFRKLNIKSESLNYRKGKGIVKMIVWVKVKTFSELDTLMKEIKKIKEVKNIYRNLPPKEIL